MSTNLTALFLGSETAWDDVQFSVWSVHPLWGGHSVSITGRGTTSLSLVERGAHRQRRYAFNIDPAEAHALLRLAVEHDLLAIELPLRTSFIPDESMTTLALTRDRRTFSIHIWSADPPSAGIRVVLEAMLALERYTTDLTPSFEGPYTAQ